MVLTEDKDDEAVRDAVEEVEDKEESEEDEPADVEFDVFEPFLKESAKNPPAVNIIMITTTTKIVVALAIACLKLNLS